MKNQQTRLLLGSQRHSSALEHPKVQCCPYPRSLEPHGKISLRNISMTRLTFNARIQGYLLQLSKPFDLQKI